MKRALIMGLCTVAAAMAATTSAAAEPAFTAGKPSAGLRLQYGIDFGNYELSANAYGLGLGARGGYTLGFGLYVGGQLEYFFGGSAKSQSSNLSLSVWQLQAEVGYDLGLAPTFVLRPQLGLGVAGFHDDFCFDDAVNGHACRDLSDNYFALAPGAVALLDVGPVFLSAEARVNVILATGQSQSALFLGVGAGMVF